MLLLTCKYLMLMPHLPFSMTGYQCLCPPEYLGSNCQLRREPLYDWLSLACLFIGALLIIGEERKENAVVDRTFNVNVNTKYVLFHNFMHGIRTLAVLIYRCIIGNANYIVKYIPFSIYRVPY